MSLGMILNGIVTYVKYTRGKKSMDAAAGTKGLATRLLTSIPCGIGALCVPQPARDSSAIDDEVPVASPAAAKRFDFQWPDSTDVSRSIDRTYPSDAYDEAAIFTDAYGAKQGDPDASSSASLGAHGDDGDGDLEMQPAVPSDRLPSKAQVVPL